MKTKIFYLLVLTVAVCIGKEQTEDIAPSVSENIVMDSTEWEKRINEIDDLSDDMKSFFYYLRMVYVDSCSNIDKFIKYFPEDSKNINSLYKLELEGFTPDFLHSFELLGQYAVKNKNNSIKKLFLVFCHSDGVIAGELSDYILTLLKDFTSGSASVLHQLDSNDQQKVLLCLNELSEMESDQIRERIRNLNLEITDCDDQAIIQVGKSPHTTEVADSLLYSINDSFYISDSLRTILQNEALQGSKEPAYRIYLYFSLLTNDIEEKLFWLRISAENGDVRGQYAYGFSLLNKDYIRLFKRGDFKNSQIAQKRARYWLQKAADAGSVAAKDLLVKLENEE